MLNARRKKELGKNTEKMKQFFINFSAIVGFLLFSSAFYLAYSFTPMTKEEHIEKFEQVSKEAEPFRRNLSECARQVKASKVDVENFLKRIPQSTMQGKCFVACILKRNSIIQQNKISLEELLRSNRQYFGEDSEIIVRLKAAVGECEKVVEGIFEICEYASLFNDCMHMKMEHVLDKINMEKRMEALGQMSVGVDEFREDEDEDDILKMLKDEL